MAKKKPETVKNTEMERKSFTGMELKADKVGSFTARIATLNVIDKDVDVTIPGAFPSGKTILISAYQHGSWSGGLPVGKGVIREDGNDVFVDGQFNLNTETGKEHYETVKFSPDIQEWSYGFIVKAADYDTEFQGTPVNRILKSLDVFEASPVLRGAGMNTACTSIKTDKQPAAGLTYIEQSEAALAAVSDLLDRTKSLADLRAKEGRTLSKANRDRFSEIAAKMSDLDAEIKSLPAQSDPAQEKAAVERLFLKFKEQNFKHLEE